MRVSACPWLLRPGAAPPPRSARGGKPPQIKNPPLSPARRAAGAGVVDAARPRDFLPLHGEAARAVPVRLGFAEPRLRVLRLRAQVGGEEGLLRKHRLSLLAL